MANLWVSTAGGSCVRQATGGDEISAQDCSSLSAAYQAAQCGDTINIDGGTYAAEQDIYEDTALDSCTTPIVMQSTPGQTATFTGDIFDGNRNIGATGKVGGSWLTLQNITNNGFIHIEMSATHNITLNNIQGGGIYMYAADNIMIENSNFGPCYNITSNGSTTFSPDPSINCGSNIKLDYPSNVTFKNDVFHDFLDDNNNPATDHFECMFIDGGTNITVDSSKFYDCQIYSIFIQDFGGVPLNGLTIQNNWFWATQGIMGACTADGVCPAENAGGSHENSVVFGNSGTGQATNVLIRYNSFDPGYGIANEVTAPAAADNARVVGNILGATGTNCISGVTYSYNIWQKLDNGNLTACGAGDTTTTAQLFVTTGSYGSSPDDLHLLSSSIAQNFVTPNTTDYQLNYDLDGNTRPTNGPRDAGSEQYSNSATSGAIGDLNADGHINIFDLSIFLSRWQQTGTGLPEDFNADNIVNIFDLSILLSHYGA